MAKKPAVQKDPWPRERAGRLGAWWRDHQRIAAETARFVSMRTGTSLLVWLLVGIALALPSGLYLVQVNLTAMTDGWEGRPGLSLYFEPGADSKIVEQVAQRLRERPEIESVTVIDQEQALVDFSEFGNLGDAIEILGKNPLPASARAVLSETASLDDLDALARFAEQEAGIDEVVLEKTWLERVIDLSTLVTRLGVVLAIMFAIGAVLVTATSVRLAIEARLEEVRVLKLVGATEAQIRRPFLYFGLLYGLGGALVAAMLISLVLLVVETPIAHLLSSYDTTLKLVGFDPMFLMILMGIGGLLGVLGSLLAARQRLSALEIV